VYYIQTNHISPVIFKEKQTSLNYTNS